MIPENTDTPLEEDRSDSWFLNGDEYRKRNGYIEARNNLNPDWVTVDYHQNGTETNISNTTN